MEICFELVIHPSKVFISLSSMSKLAHWEWKAWLSFGGWGGGGQQGRGGPVVLVEFADARFRGHKGNLSGFRFPSLLKIKQANKQTNFRSKRPWVQCVVINK